MNTYIAHHGILGQKWGVRRYQNEDGSLTPEGKERYSKGIYKYASDYSDKRKREAKDLIKLNKRDYVKARATNNLDKTTKGIVGGLAGVLSLPVSALTNIVTTYYLEEAAWATTGILSTTLDALAVANPFVLAGAGLIGATAGIAYGTKAMLDRQAVDNYINDELDKENHRRR